jgi:hypothetical protein
MNTHLAVLPGFANVANDASALCKHLDHCKVPNKPLFAMHCAAETMHGFVIGRFVTTLAVVFVLAGGYFLAI